MSERIPSKTDAECLALLHVSDSLQYILNVILVGMSYNPFKGTGQMKKRQGL